VEIDYTSSLADINISAINTIGNLISWDSTLIASLIHIDKRLRHVERSTSFVY